MSLPSLSKAVQAFVDVDHTITVYTLSVFLQIAEAGKSGITARQLIERTTLPASTVQRVLQRLGHGAGAKVLNVGKPLGLIEWHHPDFEPRAYCYTLSKSGKDLIKAMGL